MGEGLSLRDPGFCQGRAQHIPDFGRAPCLEKKCFCVCTCVHVSVCVQARVHVRV
jgi:hypothetical protein